MEKVLLLPQYRAIREHLNFANGTLYDTRQEPWQPLETLLQVPRYRYFLDADGDLARAPQGEPWAPPASAALPMEPLAAFAEVPALAALRFAKIPYGAVTYYESEMVEPDRALALWEAASARHCSRASRASGARAPTSAKSSPCRLAIRSSRTALRA